jgi:hypothetical protein
MSKTISSPSGMTRSPGSACGWAPFGPAATIVSKERVPPPARTWASKAAATARSVLPRKPSSSVGQLRGLGDRLQLVLVLHPPQPLDRLPGRDRLGALAEFLPQFGERPDRHVIVLEADLAGEPLGDPAQPVAGQGHAVPLGHLGGGALGVAEVGEEDPHAGSADRRPVGAGEPRQITDVGEVGDQHAVELTLAEHRLEAIAAPPHQAATPSSRASTPSASR